MAATDCAMSAARASVSIARPARSGSITKVYVNVCRRRRAIASVIRRRASPSSPSSADVSPNEPLRSQPASISARFRLVSSSRDTAETGTSWAAASSLSSSDTWSEFWVGCAKQVGGGYAWQAEGRTYIEEQGAVTRHRNLSRWHRPCFCRLLLTHLGLCDTASRQRDGLGSGRRVDRVVQRPGAVEAAEACLW